MAKKTFVISTVLSFGITQAVAWISLENSFTMSKLAFAAIFIQWIVFIHASGILGNSPTEKFYDLTGSCTYATLTIWSACSLGVENLSLRQKIASACVILWAGRLGSFLFSRISRDGGIDSRFTEVKKSVVRFWTFWTIQGVWVFLTASPVFILNSMVDLGTSHLTFTDAVGLFLWAFGIMIETIADIQKTQFKANATNKGRFIRGGLWSISRHPNYFGEICLWAGVFIICSSGFTLRRQWVGIISPVFVSFLLIYVSGIPLLEKAADEHWGDDAEYKAYKASVPVLIPFIGRKGDSAF